MLLFGEYSQKKLNLMVDRERFELLSWNFMGFGQEVMFLFFVRSPIRV
jgi:hypothetical protein